MSLRAHCGAEHRGLEAAVRSSISIGNLSQASADSIHRSTSLHDRGQRLESPRLKFQAEQITLFITLVNEGLIDADIHKPIEELPFTSAMVRGLSERGLHMIQELPDPNQALLDRLDEMAAAIQGLQDVPEEEKEELTEELKDFARRLAPQLALKLLPLLGRLQTLLDKSPGG